MTTENLLVLAILAAAVVLFVSEKLRVDVVAMVVLVALVLTGLVTVEEALSGFASPAVITVWAAFLAPDSLRSKAGVEQHSPTLSVRAGDMGGVWPHDSDST